VKGDSDKNKKKGKERKGKGKKKKGKAKDVGNKNCFNLNPRKLLLQILLHLVQSQQIGTR
jgi:hypothetical protein